MLLEVQERSSQARLGIFIQKDRNQIVNIRIFHVLGELQGVFQYLLINLKRIFSILTERYETSHKFI